MVNILGTLKFNQGTRNYHDALGVYFDKMKNTNNNKKIIIYDVMQKTPCEADFQEPFTKFRNVYGNRRFVTSVTAAHYHAVSLTNWIKSI